jgi:hypothetical protein
MSFAMFLMRSWKSIFKVFRAKMETAEQHIERFSDALRKINWQDNSKNDVKEINAFNVLEAYREFRIIMCIFVI